MGLDTSDPKIADAVEDVASDSDTNYVILGYVPKQDEKLKVVETGDEGLEELMESLSEGKVLFCLLQVMHHGMPKLVFIKWCGQSVPTMKKTNFSRHGVEIGDTIFKGYHVEIIAHTEDDIDEDIVTKKVDKVSGGGSRAESSGQGGNTVQAPNVKDMLKLNTAAINKNKESKSKPSLSPRPQSVRAPMKVETFKPRGRTARAAKEGIMMEQQDEVKRKEEELRSAAEELHKDFGNLAVDDITNALRRFHAYDFDGNGVLDKNEFLQLQEDLKSSVSPELIKRLADLYFGKVDADGDGGITPKEFIAAYKDVFGNERSQVAELLAPKFPNLTIKQIEDALSKFEKHDLDGNGVLDIDEFYQLKEQLLPELPKLLVRHIVSEEFDKADADHSGGVDQEEFLTAMNAILSTDTVDEAVQKARAVSNPHNAFHDFAAADTFNGILQRFTELKEACGVVGDDDDIYHKVKMKTTDDVRAKVLWSLLDKKKKQPEYTTEGWDNPKVFIVGGGPGGLRMAIEAALLGCRVVVCEKRKKFTRNNLLHLWHPSIRDLKNIGVKFFFGGFCVGSINHIAIRRLQCELTKIALLLGVKIYSGVQVHSFEPPSGEKKNWHVDIYCDNERHQPTADDLEFNVLIGADGGNSVVGQDFGFELKQTKGSQALGITANFVNTYTTEETSIDEFGLLSIYNRPFFNQLKEQHGIDLENLVYYRGETHYFVMTAKLECLLEKGVLEAFHADSNALLATNNIDRRKLVTFAREVGNYVKLPSAIKFALDSRARKEDVAIFDFSVKRQSTVASKIIKPEGDGPKILVALAGDALVEPFWPQGTGMNRAILSSLDICWMIKQWRCLGKFRQGDETDDEIEGRLLDSWMDSYKIMMNAAAEDLEPNFGLHTINPASRYKAGGGGSFV